MPIGAPHPGRISRRSLASGNRSPWAIVWCCLCDPTFSRLVELRLVTDRQTDTGRRTQGHSIYRACIASRGKNEPGENEQRSLSLHRSQPAYFSIGYCNSQSDISSAQRTAPLRTRYTKRLNQGGYIFYAGGSIAGVSCGRRWPPPTTLALTTLVAQCELSGR